MFRMHRFLYIRTFQCVAPVIEWVCACQTCPFPVTVFDVMRYVMYARRHLTEAVILSASKLLHDYTPYSHIR